ncbi:MAG: sigma-54-dependent Fis family transcriptional regulator [Kiritimatiellae bacterium]|nr:sigma-54-dependent Fis family transcriptional regulator [Kiritimatiellia bacterium]
MKQKILIVDDEKPTRDVMARALGTAYDCLTAPDADQALALLADNPDVVLMISDVRMPGTDGVALVKKAKESNPALACILLTAYGTVDLAVAAMKDGADDFLSKPITDLGQLELRVAKAIKTAGLEREVASLKERISGELEDFTGHSPAMEGVYRMIRKVAPTDATVLIEGPSGSGKELAARALHNLSRRANGPFVALECSAFEGELLKSELFGYEPGTFTGALQSGKAGCFEAADGGTLFLDEIGEIDMATQIALLRTLESRRVRRLGSAVEKPVDFRLVAATNRNLSQMVADGAFREDLYYRLNVIDLRMPALKDHREDIASLVARFIREFAQKNGSDATGIDKSALKALEDYSWPGNVRQLRNVVEKMCVLSAGGRLTLDDVPDEILRPAPSAAPRPDAPQTLEATEKAKILAVLESCGGNKTRAAEQLGISRRTLHRKLNEWRQT